MTNADPFNPSSDYTVPKGDSKYLKLEKGQTEFLPLASPILGFEYWNIDNKPVRLQEQPTNPASLPGIRATEDDNGNAQYRVNHFWAFPVIDVADGKVKILEITQKTIQNDIRAYTKNTKWGSPVLKYTFTINREGDKFETKYTVMANPASEIPKEWEAEWKRVQDNGFNMNELFTGGDPFSAEIPEVIEEEVLEDTAEPNE